MVTCRRLLRVSITASIQQVEWHFVQFIMCECGSMLVELLLFWNVFSNRLKRVSWIFWEAAQCRANGGASAPKLTQGVSEHHLERQAERVSDFSKFILHSHYTHEPQFIQLPKYISLPKVSFKHPEISLFALTNVLNDDSVKWTFGFRARSNKKREQKQVHTGSIAPLDQKFNSRGDPESLFTAGWQAD